MSELAIGSAWSAKLAPPVAIKVPSHQTLQDLSKYKARFMAISSVYKTDSTSFRWASESIRIQHSLSASGFEDNSKYQACGTPRSIVGAEDEPNGI